MSYGGYNPYAGDNGGGGRGYNPNPNPFGDENAAGYGGSHEMDSFSRQGYAASPRPMGASPRPMGASPRPMGASPRPMGSPAPGTEHPILKECGEIQSGIQNVEMMLREYPVLKKRCLADADTSDDSEAKKRLDLFRQDIMDQYRVLADRIRTVKSNPESRASSYRRPVERAEGRLRDAIQEFQNQEAEYRQDTKARLARQLRIVNPEATDAQINKAVEDGNTQVFQQAVMGNRTEQANRVLGAVQKRHEEMLQIERSLLELLDLLNDMQELLVKQDVVIQNIATETEEAGEALKDANVQLENATQSARGARKKKWWCLGIGLTIIVIIVVAVVAYILVNRAANGGGGSSSNNNGNNSNNNSGSNSNTGNSNNNNAGSSNTGNSNNNNAGSSSSQKRNPFQRDVLDELQMNTARAATIHSEPAPAGRVARPRFHKVRGVDAALDRAAEADVKKRFVVDWDSVDSTGSED